MKPLSYTPSFDSPTLVMRIADWETMLVHCLDGMPDEACGLLLGPVDQAGAPTGVVEQVYLCANADQSALTYTIDSRDQLRAMRAAEAADLEIIGVFHSHTHTDAYPSQTDIRQVVDPSWIYVIVGFRLSEPETRAFRIVDGSVREVAVQLQ